MVTGLGLTGTVVSYHRPMATDVTLYLVNPGDQSFSSQVVGSLTIRGIKFSGQVYEGQRCLNVDVETHPPAQHLTWNDGKVERPVGLAWLQLFASLWTRMNPRSEVGTIHIIDSGALRARWARNGIEVTPLILRVMSQCPRGAAGGHGNLMTNNALNCTI